MDEQNLQEEVVVEQEETATPKKKEKKVGKLGKDTPFDYVLMAVLAIFAVITFYPMWYVVIGSFSNGNDYLKGGVYFFPRIFTGANYSVVFNDDRIWQGFLITIIRCAIGPTLLVFFTSMVAYGMSRRELPGRKGFNFYFLFTMFFSGGMVPAYLVYKFLGMLNTFWMYIIPGMLNVYDMILIRSFFNGSPEELHEAAVIDGAGEYRIFLTIFLPLSMPIIATIFLWGLLGHWNDYTTSMIYVPSRPELSSLQYVLMKIINEGDNSSAMGGLSGAIVGETSGETISYAAMVFGTVPILIAYPFLQKYFTKGLYVGSLKG